VVLHTTYVLWSTIKLWCCVSFFGSGGKSFLVFHTYGTYCTVVFTQNRDAVAQVHTRFTCAGGTLFVLLCNFFLAVNRFWFYILLMYLEYQKVVVFC
jgi:hypothetical protein